MKFVATFAEAGFRRRRTNVRYCNLTQIPICRTGVLPPVPCTPRHQKIDAEVVRCVALHLHDFQVENLLVLLGPQTCETVL